MLGESPQNDNGGERLWFLRRPVQFALDIAVLSGAFLVSFLPAINIRLEDFYFDTAIVQLPLAVLVQFSALFLFGGYSIIWRYVSISDVAVFVKAAALSCFVLLTLRFAVAGFISESWQVPLSVIAIDTILGFGGLLGLRVLRRLLYEVAEKKNFRGARVPSRKVPTLFVGAGRIGSATVKDLVGRANTETDIKGFVDDDKSKRGGSVHGVKVLGTTEDLPRLVSEFTAEQVVIAIDQAKGADIRRIMEVCRAIPVKTRIVPSLGEIVHGRVQVNRIRDVEIEDLLGREPIQLDDENLHSFIGGGTVLVTGAGGSIGSELVRQISRFSPSRILLVERAEFMLFQVEREMAADFPDIAFEAIIADVGDEPRMREVFAKYKPQVVFHAAAHKHVPLIEANPGEAIKNNVFASKTLGEIAGESGVRDFVLVSTDKAVNPTSVMGASKRLAEIVLQSLNGRFATNFVAVRFGNVLGSAGSVVPIFKEQIRRGEPITVTHPEMTRYFMTIPEAAQLVLQAGALGSGGEIFVLDMGRPVRILDLAEDMVRLSGLEPYVDVDIVFSGIRPGEKLYEELEISGENLLKTRNPKIFIGKIAEYSGEQVSGMVSDFREAVASADPMRIRALINRYIPEATITESHGDPADDVAGDEAVGGTPHMDFAENRG